MIFVLPNISRLLKSARLLLTATFCIAVIHEGISQHTTITGIVIDETSGPHVGANIVLNNMEHGAVTNAEGQFTFNNIPNKKYVISISSVGYKTISFLFDADTTHAPIKIMLQPKIQQLEEIQVNGNQNEISKRRESLPIQLIEEEFLKESQAPSLMQALNNIPGVQSMDIGTGLSKPMIRGLGFYRVVVAQNGIKHEGQLWSNHHGISVDRHDISHVEIIKGPASLQYGSDAIGGVINILPSHVPLSQGLTGEVSITGKSNSRYFGGSANALFRSGDFYFSTTMTHNRFGDFTVPATDSFLLPAPVNSIEASHKVPLSNRIYNTAGNESAFSFVAGIIKSWGNSLLKFSFHENNAGFFDWQGVQHDSIRNTHLENFYDNNLPYQSLRNYSVHHFTNRYFNHNKLEIGLGYQQNVSKEYGYLSDRTGNRSEELQHFRSLDNLELLLDLKTISGNVYYTINGPKNQSIKFGISTQYLHHSSDGYSHILPEYNRLSAGSFITYRYHLSDKWVVNSGLRVDLHSFKMEQSINPDPSFGDSIFNSTYKTTYPGTSFSAGINYLPDNKTIMKVNVGKSYRIPSAYELGAYGLHRHEGRFEKGDLNNQPETAWQLDFGYEKKWKNIELSISPFLNYFTNYLYLNPTPELRSEGQVYEYQQTTAMLTGGETTIHFLPHRHLRINVSAEYVYGVNLNNNGALPFTPPFSSQAEIRLRLNQTKKLTSNFIGLETIGVAKQKYTVPNELTTPGYVSFNAKAGTDVTLGEQEISFRLIMSNLLNRKYYNHISFYRRLRIPEPGRNIQINIQIPF